MFRIIGNHNVAGKAPGDVLSDEELAGCNLAALVEGGHLEPIKKAVKTATSTQADEADQEEN